MGRPSGHRALVDREEPAGDGDGPDAGGRGVVSAVDVVRCPLGARIAERPHAGAGHWKSEVGGRIISCHGLLICPFLGSLTPAPS